MQEKHPLKATPGHLHSMDGRNYPMNAYVRVNIHCEANQRRKVNSMSS